MSEAAQEVPFDAAKAEAFAGSLLEHLNHGAWCLMASVGHRTGLFDIMRDLPASTVQDIARAGNLNERYVRDWSRSRRDEAVGQTRYERENV